MTLTSPPSMTATTELVVPRSMPMIFSSAMCISFQAKSLVLECSGCASAVMCVSVPLSLIFYRSKNDAGSNEQQSNAATHGCLLCYTTTFDPAIRRMFRQGNQACQNGRSEFRSRHGKAGRQPSLRKIHEESVILWRFLG